MEALSVWEIAYHPIKDIEETPLLTCIRASCRHGKMKRCQRCKVFNLIKLKTQCIILHVLFYTLVFKSLLSASVIRSRISNIHKD